MKNKGIKGYSPTMHSLKVIEHLTVPWCILVQFVSSLKSKVASGNEIFLDLKEFETFCEWAHSTSLKKTKHATGRNGSK